MYDEKLRGNVCCIVDKCCFCLKLKKRWRGMRFRKIRDLFKSNQTDKDASKETIVDQALKIVRLKQFIKLVMDLILFYELYDISQ